MVHPNVARWDAAAEKVAMALCEAGHPVTYNPWGGQRDFAGVPHASLDYKVRPPEDAVRKAFELAGIGDLWTDPGVDSAA